MSFSHGLDWRIAIFVVFVCSRMVLYLVDMYHPAELTWQWKITMFNRRYILRLLFFQCHLMFRGCNLVQDVFCSENGDIPASYVSLPEAS